MNYEEEIRGLEERIRVATDKKSRAEAKLDALKDQERDLLDRLKQMGLKPEDLEGEIQRLEEEIKSHLALADQYLPRF